MNVLEQILRQNQSFVHDISLLQEQTGVQVGKLPKRKLAVFTCMDTRLVDFLEPALGLRREDAVIIKNAGNSVTGSFEATIRSLVIAVFELGVREIIVIGHEDCGVAHSTAEAVIAKMLDRGISPAAIKMVKDDLEVWLDTFHHPHENVEQVVKKIRNNPLLPADVPVHGLMFEPHTGEVAVLVNGYGQAVRLMPV